MPDFFDNDFVRKIKEIYGKIASLSIFQKSPSTKFVVIAFCCIIAVLLIVSGVSVAKQGGTDTEEETTANEQVQASLDATFEQEDLLSNCLFVLTDNDKQAIHSLVLVGLDSVKDSIKFSFIEPTERIKVSNFDGNMNQHLQNGGVNQLVWAVSEKYGVTIDRYLLGDELGFTKLMSDIGNITVEIDSSINYSHNGVSFIIDSGTQTLTPDMMLKYFLYLSHNIDKRADKAVEAMMMYVSEIFCKNCEENDTDGMKEQFENILGYFETNISALDYSRYKQAIESLSSGELASKVTIVADPATLSIINSELE